jgi:hypothetical protein
MKRFKDFSKLYEFEKQEKLPTPEQVSFMDTMYQRIKKEVMPTVPPQFKADYNRGREIVIHTDSNKDLRVGAKIVDDKMVTFSKPINEPEFEINFNFQSANMDGIIRTIKSEFDKSETKGIFSGREQLVRDLPSYMDDDDDEDEMREDEDDIDIPITAKPKRIKRSIEIKIIKNVLEDAFILDDIELKQVTIDELIRRMLLESRKK